MVLMYSVCGQGRTGYPFIDAIMRQLRQEGWIHHLARHAVACFLTRGDLWQSWEEGQKVTLISYIDVFTYNRFSGLARSGGTRRKTENETIFVAIVVMYFIYILQVIL